MTAEEHVYGENGYETSGYPAAGYESVMREYNAEEAGGRLPRPEIRRSLSGCEMILSASGEKAEEETWQERILAVNRIKGVLGISEEYIDNHHRFLYDVTSLQPFSVYCESGELHSGELRRLFEGILDMVSEIENYLVDSEYLILRPEYLFVSWEDNRVWAPWYPGIRRPVREGLTEITEYILRKIGTSDQDAVILTCRFLHELERSNIRIDELRGVFAEYENRKGGVFDEGGRYARAGGESESQYNDSLAVKSAGDLTEYDRYPRNDRENDAVKKEIRRYAPEKDTIRMALILTPVAFGLYLLLHYQNYVVLTREESAAAGIALASAVICAVLITARSAIKREEKQQDVSGAFDVDVDRGPESIEGVRADRADHDRAEFDREEYGREDRDRAGYAGEEFDTAVFEGTVADRRRGETVLLTDCPSSFNEDREYLLVPENASGNAQTIPLTGKEVLIGHVSGSADVRLTDPTVSRIHARCVLRDGQWYLRDLNSRNGTSAGGKKVVGAEEIPLTDGLRITIGASSFKVSL